jgi:membrane fusion protein, adhesin transport system
MTSESSWRSEFAAGEIGAEVGGGPGRFAHILLFAIVSFFLLFFLWSNNADLDQVTRGEGKIIPSSQIQIVQHLEGGIVSDIRVTEGDIVEKDQVIVRMENTFAETEARETRLRQYKLLGVLARLQAEFDGTIVINFPDEVAANAPAVVGDERQLFSARQSQLEQQIEILRDQAAQKRLELNESTGRLSELERAQALKQEEHDLVAPLVEQNVIPRLDLIRIRQEIQEFATQVAGIKITNPRIESSVREAERRIEEKRSSFRAEVQQKLGETRAELTGVIETLRAEADRVTRTDVRSPVRGTVNKLLVNTIGGVVQPGQDLVEIVPLEDKLLVEALIRPSDRAELHPGLEAVVKVSAYDFSIHGGLQATLVDISADTIKDEQGESFFRIRLRTDRSDLGADKPIVPGMTATVDILTGKRTVLDYIMKPILKARQTALTER